MSLLGDGDGTPAWAPTGSQVLPLASLPASPLRFLTDRWEMGRSDRGEGRCWSGASPHPREPQAGTKPQRAAKLLPPPVWVVCCESPRVGSSSQPTAPGKGSAKTSAPRTVKRSCRYPKRPAVPGERRWFAACLISGDNRQRWASGRNAVPGVHTGSDAGSAGVRSPLPAGPPRLSPHPSQPPESPEPPGPGCPGAGATLFSRPGLSPAAPLCGGMLRWGSVPKRPSSHQTPAPLTTCQLPRLVVCMQ